MTKGSQVEVEQRLSLTADETAALILSASGRLTVRKEFVNFGIENLAESIRKRGMWLRARVNVDNIDQESEEMEPVATGLFATMGARAERRLGIMHAVGIVPKFTLKQNVGVAADLEITNPSEIADVLGIPYTTDLIESLIGAGYSSDAGFSTDRKEYACADGITITQDRSTCIHLGREIDRTIVEVERMVELSEEEEARSQIRALLEKTLGHKANTAKVSSTLISCILAHTDSAYAADLINSGTISPKNAVTIYQAGELTAERLAALLPHLLPAPREVLAQL